jgi:Na+/H+-dicarboxylate symporter
VVDVAIVLVIGAVAVAVGIGMGIVLAPKVGRLFDRPDPDEPANDEEPRDRAD